MAKREIIDESGLDQETRLVREEMANRKLARDRFRRLKAGQDKEVLRRFAAIGFKPTLSQFEFALKGGMGSGTIFLSPDSAIFYCVKTCLY
jgi:hypothetical protein